MKLEGRINNQFLGVKGLSVGFFFSFIFVSSSLGESLIIVVSCLKLAVGYFTILFHK